MNLSTYNLLVEPIKQDYYDLLNYASAECKYALVVIRSTMQFNVEGQEILKILAGYLYKEKQTDEWTGTKIINQKARVLEFHYVPEVVEILQMTVSGLYQWLQPKFPEDLCLLRGDETPWLVTISHENDGYFILSEQEQNHFFSTLPQFRLLVEKAK
jgi:hypothetical protein